MELTHGHHFLMLGRRKATCPIACSHVILLAGRAKRTFKLFTNIPVKSFWNLFKLMPQVLALLYDLLDLRRNIAYDSRDAYKWESTSCIKKFKFSYQRIYLWPLAELCYYSWGKVRPWEFYRTDLTGGKGILIFSNFNALRMFFSQNFLTR